MVFRTIAVISGLLISTTSIAGNIPYEQAQKSGIKRCLPAVKGLSEHLIADDRHGANSNWFTKNTDQKPFQSVIEREFENDKITEISNLLVVPTADGQCAYSYTRTAYSEQT